MKNSHKSLVIGQKQLEEGAAISGDSGRMTHDLRSRGFTLIELLVVIAIIGLLSSVVLASLNSARQKSRDARRIADMVQIRTALELYYDSNRAYPPITSHADGGWGPWDSQCAGGGALSASNVIPGLVPTYMPSFPADPSMNTSASSCCYLYYSNGTDYKFLDHNCPSEINYLSQPTFIDPARDSGASSIVVDGTGIWSWAFWSGPATAGW